MLRWDFEGNWQGRRPRKWATTLFCLPGLSGLLGTMGRRTADCGHLLDRSWSTATVLLHPRICIFASPLASLLLRSIKPVCAASFQVGKRSTGHQNQSDVEAFASALAPVDAAPGRLAHATAPGVNAKEMDSVATTDMMEQRCAR